MRVGSFQLGERGHSWPILGKSKVGRKEKILNEEMSITNEMGG